MFDVVTSSIIRDVLHMKHENYNDRLQYFLSYNEFKHVTYLLTVFLYLIFINHKADNKDWTLME